MVWNSSETNFQNKKATARQIAKNVVNRFIIKLTLVFDLNTNCFLLKFLFHFANLLVYILH